MTQEELNAIPKEHFRFVLKGKKIIAIPKEHFRFVLKGKKIIAIFTDDGVTGGVFWDTKYWDWGIDYAGNNRI